MIIEIQHDSKCMKPQMETQKKFEKIPSGARIYSEFPFGGFMHLLSCCKNISTIAILSNFIQPYPKAHMFCFVRKKRPKLRITTTFHRFKLTSIQLNLWISRHVVHVALKTIKGSISVALACDCYKVWKWKVKVKKLCLYMVTII